jgi:methionyl aminopeptidase
MTVQREEELEGLKAAGRIVALALDAMQAAVRAGITTAELDAVAGRVFDRYGARSAPQMVYDFPGLTCISVNDEVVHGIPGGRTLAAGDVVKLDVTAEKDGYMADAARTVAVGAGANPRLGACAEAAFRQGLSAARAGTRVGEIGRRVEREVRRAGFRVVREFAGHGIGRTIHEAPTVPNFDDRSPGPCLEVGMVVTIEPILAAGAGNVVLGADGWTVRTADGSLAAHFEHTLVVTRSAPVILTAAS